MLAGADRVEGTLFGNGERTGNLDIVTVALNLYTQGIDPGLDFSDLPAVRAEYEALTRMEVPARWQYAGDLVFTAFSGSHQDAIKKGMDRRRAAQRPAASTIGKCPTCPIDPQDIGRTYEAIIRINSQSGKGGVAYVLQTEFGLDLPKTDAPGNRRGGERRRRQTGARIDPGGDQKLCSTRCICARVTPLRLEDYDVHADPASKHQFNLAGARGVERRGARNSRLRQRADQRLRARDEQPGLEKLPRARLPFARDRRRLGHGLGGVYAH